MAKRWYVRFEGDIRDNEFTVLGHTAADALRSATREAHSAPPSAQVRTSAASRAGGARADGRASPPRMRMHAVGWRHRR